MRDLIERIQAAAAGTEGSFAAFDFDNTCITGDIAEAAVAQLCEMGRLDPAVMRAYEHSMEAGDIRHALLSYAETIAGLPPDAIDPLVAETIAAKGIAIKPAVLELARALERAGIAIWIVSASPESLVASAMRQLGFPGRAIGLRDRAPYSMLEGKVDCIKAYIHPSLRPVFAIGDSVNDIPMLEYAAIPAVVSPSAALADIARQRGREAIPDQV